MTDVDEATPGQRADRDALVNSAVQAARAAVAVIRQSFDDNTADFDDAVKALPVVHKIIEHVERIEVARKTPAQWQVVQFSIVLDGSAVQERPAIAARAVQPVQAVIDIDAETGEPI
jgi:hypothetical protein